jgi:hypothetical protein
MPTKKESSKVRRPTATYILAVVLFTVPFDSIRYVILPAKTVQQVELLPGPPDKPFKVVGHVFIDGSNKRGWQSIAEAAREEAADMGADAVFMGDMGQYQSGMMTMPSGSTSTTTGTLRSNSNRSTFNTNTNTFSGPTVATGINRKQLSAIAIVYQNP